MQLEYAKNPRWANTEQTLIDLVIKWDEVAKELPFTASLTDTEAHGRALFAAAVAGEFGPVAEYVAPSPVPPTVPASVTMRQARLAMLSAGLLAAVNAAIAAMPGVAGEAARIEWEYAQTVERDSPLVAGLTAALNLTQTQIDDLFALAATL